MIRIIFASLLFITLLNACSLFQDNTPNNQKGLCNELKRRMIFNGATGNQTLASQQRGEMAKLTQAYNQNCS